MPRILSLAVLCLPCLGSIASHGEDAVATTGKRRASASAIQWDVRDVNHPLLGPIKFAARRTAVATPVGDEKVVSQVYVSCQKNLGKIAVELSNASESNPAGGMGPRDMPRLVCNSPGPEGESGPVQSELAAKWEVNDLGDTLARGLSASDLRRCTSIDVLQNVALPAGWAYASQRVDMELLPYGKALDAVFKACGATTTVAPVARPPAAAVWKRARTIAKGRTNVRAAASAKSPLVVKLRPGAALLVQRTSTDWWKVKPRGGAGFSGYVRKDRLVFE